MPISVPRDSPLGNMVPPAKVDALKEMSPASAVLPVVSMPPLERLSNTVLQFCHDNNQKYDVLAAKIMKPQILDKYQRTKQSFELQLKSAKNILKIINSFEQYLGWLSELLRNIRYVSLTSLDNHLSGDDCQFTSRRGTEDDLPAMKEQQQTHENLTTLFPSELKQRPAQGFEDMNSQTLSVKEMVECSKMDNSLEDDSVDFVTDTRKKATKHATIGANGGDIELYGYKVEFPFGSLTEDIDFTISINNNPADYPKHGFPITSILDVEPSMLFEKHVSVTMRTWFSAMRGKQLDAQILQRSEGGDWIEDQQVVLSEKNEVKFKVLHFSGRISVAGKRRCTGSEDDNGEGDSDLEGDAHLFNSVHMHKATRVIASIFCKEKKALVDAQKHFGKHEMVLVPPAEIRGRYKSRFIVELKCIDPEGITYVHKQKENIPAEFIGQEALIKDCLPFYFRPVRFPTKHNGSFMADYSVKVKDTDTAPEDVQLEAVLSADLFENSASGQMNFAFHQQNAPSKIMVGKNVVDDGSTLTTEERSTSSAMNVTQ